MCPKVHGKFLNVSPEAS